MQKSSFVKLLALSLVLAGSQACERNNLPEQAPPSPAFDLASELFIARKIITMDESMPSARAVLVVNGEVVAVSDDPDVFYEDPIFRHATLNRSFENDVLMPGFIDPHLHPLMAAVILPMAFVTPEDWSLPRGEYPGVHSPYDYKSRLGKLYAEFDEASDAQQPFFSWGWHPLWHGELNREWLAELAPNRPVFVWRSTRQSKRNQTQVSKKSLASRLSHIRG